ncbi:hypothetical protein EBR96_07485 [bacterium]|nr:hypothetical protein [bacterium]
MIELTSADMHKIRERSPFFSWAFHNGVSFKITFRRTLCVGIKFDRNTRTYRRVAAEDVFCITGSYSTEPRKHKTKWGFGYDCVAFGNTDVYRAFYVGRLLFAMFSLEDRIPFYLD